MCLTHTAAVHKIRKMTNFLYRNRLQQPHASNTCCLNEPLTIFRAEELLKKHQLQIESRDDNRSKLNALASLSENARCKIHPFTYGSGCGGSQCVQIASPSYQW